MKLRRRKNKRNWYVFVPECLRQADKKKELRNPPRHQTNWETCQDFRWRPANLEKHWLFLALLAWFYYNYSYRILWLMHSHLVTCRTFESWWKEFATSHDLGVWTNLLETGCTSRNLTFTWFQVVPDKKSFISSCLVESRFSLAVDFQEHKIINIFSVQTRNSKWTFLWQKIFEYDCHKSHWKSWCGWPKNRFLQKPMINSKHFLPTPPPQPKFELTHFEPMDIPKTAITQLGYLTLSLITSNTQCDNFELFKLSLKNRVIKLEK